MFRTVIINNGEEITLKENWLTVSVDNTEKRIPINDIYSVVIDNRFIKLTVSIMNRLTAEGAHIVLCDESHMPSTVILPNANYYRPLNILKKQISISGDCKESIWRKIVSRKIFNQGQVLSYAGGDKDKVNRIFSLSETVFGDDDGNCEAIAAKLFFRGMYGSSFIRMEDDSINAALNYGYAIVRSSVAKSLIAHGFNCVLGIHHVNEFNDFNLADDLMEPIRPLVDYWVYWNCEELYDELSKENRYSLVNLINTIVIMDERKMKLRNAIDAYVVSLSRAICECNPEKICIPEIYEKCFVNNDYD